MEPRHSARNLDRTLHRAVWLLAIATVGVAAGAQRQLGYSVPVVVSTTLVLLAPVAAWWALERRLAAEATGG